MIADNQELISKNQKRAIDGLERQAKRTRLKSDAKFLPLSPCINVTIPIPEVDRGKTDLRNIIGEK